MRNCFNKILIAINVCDSVHLIFAILDGVRNSFVEHYPHWLLHIFPFTHYPLYRYSRVRDQSPQTFLRISMCGSIFLVVSVAIERHSAVCNPLAYRSDPAMGLGQLMIATFRQQHTGKWRPASYILPSSLLAIIVNITRSRDVLFSEISF